MYQPIQERFVSLRIYLFFFFVCIVPGFQSYAQRAEPIDFVPVSPGVAALGKFGNTPVSYYTGTASVEIPIYTVEQNGLKLPIKLMYHAGGIKVAEVASWVGLGFALSAGGTITRVEHGLADDLGINGYLWNGRDLNALNLRDRVESARGYLDLEADDYIFNFAGVSGKFVLDKAARPLIVPHQPIRIEPLGYMDRIIDPAGPPTQGGILAWRVVTMDGVEYLFREIEESWHIQKHENDWHVNAWHLTTVISANKQDTVLLEYEEGGHSVDVPISQMESFRLHSWGAPCMDPPSSKQYGERIEFMARRLRRIKFRSGVVEFIAGAKSRCDLYNDEWLDRVVVRNASGSLVKEVKFTYGYMRGSNISSVDVPCSGNGADVRLMLTSVVETGKTPYTFDYIRDIGLPERYSRAQDHWGFYNSNPYTTLIPQYVSLSNGQYIFGRERDADSVKSQQGTLRRITYPTGGRTEFEYESNRVTATSMKQFPDFMIAYDIVRNYKRNIVMNYGNVSAEVTRFRISNLGAEPFLYFWMDAEQASGAYFEIVNDAGEVIPVSQIDQQERVRTFLCTNLADGEYRIFARNFDAEQGPASTNYTLTIDEYLEVYKIPESSNAQRIIGGLRIKRIVDTDALTGATLRKEFSYSPGTLNWGVKYTSTRKEYDCYTLDGVFLRNLSVGTYLAVSSTSNYPLSNTQGAPVGYPHVTMAEYADMPDGTKKRNGITSFQYTDGTVYPDVTFSAYWQEGKVAQIPLEQGPVSSYQSSDGTGTFKFPYAPPESKDFMRGLLYKTTVSKTDDGNDTVRVETNNYVRASLNRSVPSVKCAMLFDSRVATSPVSFINPINAPNDEVAFSTYTTSAQYPLLTYSTIETFAGTTKKLVERTDYSYSPDNLLPTRVVKTTSSREVDVLFTSYPQDYATGTSFIDKMVQANIIGMPVERVACKQTASGGDIRVVSGQVIVYSASVAGQLDSVMDLENAASIMLPDFKFSNLQRGKAPYYGPPTQKTVFGPDQRYITGVYFDKYNAGALIQQRKSNDVLLSYVWDHYNTLVVAKVLNAAIDNVAYSSFESDGASWTITGGAIEATQAFTGRQSLRLEGASTVRKLNLAADSYVVSYWSKGGVITVNGAAGVKGDTTKNGWTYNEHLLSSATSVTVAGSGMIDELRLHPVSARMTTFCHRPLIGVSDVIDENSTPTFYQYDAAGRLETVRDVNGNIVQYYQYHYKGQ